MYRIKIMIGTLALFMIMFYACHLPPPTPKPGQDPLVTKGRDIFFNETFAGNSRTCGTCHPAENNFTLDANFIASLPDDDPLFVAETNPDLKENFENPRLMREFGMILENLDGFDSLSTKFTMRGIPHVLGLGHSVESQAGPRTGWSGDGAPGDGSLRAFATGAVIQHFPKTTNRIPGKDFRLPTEEELDALEAFQLSLGRQEELSLPLPLKSVVAARGQELFNSPTEGKCFACHFNAGANGAPNVFGENAGNLNFNTGVENLPDQPPDLTGELVPPDDGFGIPGDSTFNTPSVVEAADTGPFFHNNTVETIEGAVAFYNGDAFNNSPSGQLIASATGSGINLDATQVVEVASFLRVINALENIRQTIEFLEAGVNNWTIAGEKPESLLNRALVETDDAVNVLSGANLHPNAVIHLKISQNLTSEAIKKPSKRAKLSQQAIDEQEMARNLMVEPSK